MKWIGIVNPNSGGRTRKFPPDRTLEPFKEIITEFQFTQYPGHAKEIAKASHNFEGVAVFGGDGTLFEALNGIDFKKQSVAIIPAGTGNTFARTLGITCASEVVNSIKKNRIIDTDLAEIDLVQKNGSSERYFFACSVGLGYPALAAKIGNQYFKRLGRFCYPVACTIAPLINKPFRAQLAYDNKLPEDKLLTSLLVNNTSFAGKFFLFHQASVNDGYLDAAESGSGFFRQNLHNISVFSGQYFYNPSKTTRIKSIAIDLEEPRDCMIDGEIFPRVTRVKITILPHILKCYK